MRWRRLVWKWYRLRNDPKIAIVLRPPGGDVPRHEQLDAAYQNIAKDLTLTQ